jgi:hypothetical protein
MSLCEARPKQVFWRMSNAHSLQQAIINAMQVSKASNKAGDTGHMGQSM